MSTPSTPNTPEKECCYSSCLAMTLTTLSMITIPALLMYLLNHKAKPTDTTTTTKPGISTPHTASEEDHTAFEEAHVISVETTNPISSHELE